MIAATHFGHCQVCGNKQKAPGNMMAKHGYTVQWNFFEGVCWGSDEPPFELDKSVAQKAYDMQQSVIDRHVESVAKLNGPLVLTGESADGRGLYTAWKFEYIKVPQYQRNVRSGNYEWLQVDVKLSIYIGYQDSLSLKAEYRLKKEIEGADGSATEWNKWDAYGTFTMDPAELIHKLEEPRVRMHEQYIKQLRDYRDWQAKRIASWKVEKMKPVVEELVKQTHVIEVVTAEFNGMPQYVCHTHSYNGGGYGQTHITSKTSAKAEGKRYTKRGAEMMISKLRGWKTMKAVAL